MSHGPSREVMHVRQQLWCDACTATLKPFRLAVPFAELRVFLVVAFRRVGVVASCRDSAACAWRRRTWINFLSVVAAGAGDARQPMKGCADKRDLVATG